MKIRILAGLMDRSSGSSVYHRELALRLASRGHRVSLVCFGPAGLDPGTAEVFEVPPAAPEPLRFFWRFASPLNHRRCGRSLARSRVAPVDVVIGGEHLFLKAHRRLFPGTPWIYLPHSLVVDQEIRGYGLPPAMELVTTRFYVHLQRWALNHADRTLRFTRQACDSLTARYGRGVDPRYVVNPMGIELPDPPPREPAGGPIRLVWVGQLIPRKRIDFALSVLERLRGHAWRFDIVGEGASRGALEEQVGRSRLSDRVRFHGFQQDPRGWYRRSDLLLFPSLSENCPVAMLESMAHGVPCLAMRADGVRFFNANTEIISDDVDGFLAATDEDFAAKLRRLIEDAGVLEAAGASARRKMEDFHAWDKHIDRYELLFGELAGRRGPAARPGPA